MIKYIQRISRMKCGKLCGLSLLALFGLTGCRGYFTWWEPVAIEDKVIYRDNSPVEAEVDVSVSEEQVQLVAPSPQEDNRFIDYRRTAAEYRSYGERANIDQRYTSAAAGGNISASIPPTIDEEVADYDESVDMAFENAHEGDSVGGGMDSGDEAVEDWLAEEGNTLRGLLSEWCERAGWRLVWNSNRNYTLSAGAMFRGRFADVASALIRSFARAQPAPLATFFKGNRVLVVETKEDENAYN